MSAANDRMLDALFKESEQQGRCVFTSDARVRGMLNRRARLGLVARPAEGLFARKDYWRKLKPDAQALHIIKALQGLHPSWVFCHESAALVWGLPISYASLSQVHITTTQRERRCSAGIIVRHCIEEDRVDQVDGVFVTSLVRTSFDCLRKRTFDHGLPIADRTVALSGLSPTKLQQRFREIGKGATGVRRAIGIMGYSDAKSESWLESYARALMITQGFSLPRLQVELPRPLEPSRTYRVDFLWDMPDGSQVIGEADGMLKYHDDEQLERSAVDALADEQHREAELTLYGAPVLRISYEDTQDTATFVNKLKRYGIPQSPEVVKAIRNLAAHNPASSLRYARVHVSPEIIERLVHFHEEK